MARSQFNDYLEQFQDEANQNGTSGDQGFLDVVPYPVDAFPKEYAEIITQASTTLRAEASHIGTAILGAVSLAVGNTNRVQPSAFQDSIPCTTWMILVEPSGAGKGKAQKFGFGPLNAIKKAKMIEVSNARAKVKAEIDQLKKDLYAAADDQGARREIRHQLEAKERIEIEDYYLIIDDITMESVRKANLKNRHGIGIVRDEIAGWYNSFGKYSKAGGVSTAEESFYIETYDGGDLIPFRSGASGVICPMPFTTVFGGTQTDALMDLGRNNRMVSGFVFRILFSFPEEKPLQYKELADFISDRNTDGNFLDLQARYGMYINKIMSECKMRFADDAEFIPEPSTVMFSDEAVKVYLKWWNGQTDFANSLKVSKSVQRTVRSIVTRLDMNCFRLCLIMEVMKWTLGESTLEKVSGDTVERVVKLMKYYRYTMLKVYTEVEKIRFESGSVRSKRVQIEYKKVFGRREELTRDELLERITREHGITELTATKYLLEDEKQLVPRVLSRKDGRQKIYRLNDIQK